MRSSDLKYILEKAYCFLISAIKHADAGSHVEGTRL